MGDRHVIVPLAGTYPKIGIYIHWFDRAKFNRVLEKCRNTGVRKPSQDIQYCMSWVCYYTVKEFGERTDEALGVGLYIIEDPSVKNPPGSLIMFDDNFKLIANPRGLQEWLREHSS